MTQFNYEGGESPVYDTIISVIENYGWYLLIIATLALYIYQKFRPTINKYLEDHPDLFAARLDARQAYAEKLQKKYSDDATEYQQKLEEKETRKREEWLAKQSGSSGHKLGSTSSNKTYLKPEFNPLTGDTSTRSYRPQKKSACSGGGCGK